MSPAPIVERECGSKTRFATKRMAAAAARRLANETRKPWGPYECSYCAGFHLTSRAPVQGLPWPVGSIQWAMSRGGRMRRRSKPSEIFDGRAFDGREDFFALDWEVVEDGREGR